MADLLKRFCPIVERMLLSYEEKLGSNNPVYCHPPSMLFLPGLSEEQDAIGATAVKGDTAALIGGEFVPETENGDPKFILRPDLDRSNRQRGIGREKPLKEHIVLFTVGDTDGKAPQILEDAQEYQLEREK